MKRVARQVSVVVASTTLVLLASGGCSQVLDITPGTLISDEAGTTGCAPGRATCGGGATCAIDLGIDPAHCGACDNVCPGDHATATCENGQCKFACSAGFADCDQSPSNACETELAETSRHCGACGHDCFGGGCKTGVCQPRAFADTEDPVRQIAINGTTLYALSSWTVSTHDTQSGASTVLMSPPSEYVDQIAVGAAGAWAMRHVGSTVEVDSLANKQCVLKDSELAAITADDTGLYAAFNRASPQVSVIDPTTNCVLNVLHSVDVSKPVVSLVSDGEYLYFTTSDGALSKWKKDGSTPTALPWVKKSPGANRIVATDALYIYWTSTRGLNRVKKLVACDDEAGSCVDFFAPDAHGAFLVDDQNVYVATAASVSLRDKTTGATKGSILASEPVLAVATDTGSIYVGEGQHVERVAR